MHNTSIQKIPDVTIFIRALNSNITKKVGTHLATHWSLQ